MTTIPSATNASTQFPVASLDHGINDRERGAVFTKRSVVNFMLDLVEYQPSLPLHEMRLLEPSFGGGRFLIEAVDRLIDGWREHSLTSDFGELFDAIRAVELDLVWCRSW